MCGAKKQPQAKRADFPKLDTVSAPHVALAKPNVSLLYVVRVSTGANIETSSSDDFGRGSINGGASGRDGDADVGV